MRRLLVMASFMGIAIAPAHAQTSASFKLNEFTLNAGGDPQNGSSAASASFHIKLDAIGDAAKKVRSDFDKVPTSSLAQADKETIKKSLEALANQADQVKSRLNDGKPASSEVQQLLTQIAGAAKFMAAHPTPTANANWEALRAAVTKVQQAFEMR
jgi:hypothetical protein